MVGSADALDRFAENGYAVVPGVFDVTATAALREVCAARLRAEGSRELTPTAFLASEQLAAVPFHDAVVGALKRILGADYLIYPNLTVRRGVYVGWHVDDAFIGPRRQYVWAPGFQHVQGAIYLQDNEDETGGGIDVIPGSHLLSCDGRGTVEYDLGEAAALLLAEHAPQRIRSRAGDLVLWHARLWHRSTPATDPAADPAADRTDPAAVPADAADSADRADPADQPEKYGVFFSASRNDPYAANRFLAHLLGKRVRLVDGAAVVNPRHAALVDMRFPADYPVWLRDRMASLGVSAATL